MFLEKTSCLLSFVRGLMVGHLMDRGDGSFG